MLASPELYHRVGIVGRRPSRQAEFNPLRRCVRLLTVLRKRGKERPMAERKLEKCAHPGCECTVQKGTKYCSEYCESIADRPSIACECGHAQCAAGEAAGAAVVT